MGALTATEMQALGVSLVVAGRAVLIALPLAAIAAYALARGRFWGRTLLDAAVHAPLVLPPVVVGYGLLVLLGVRGPVGGAIEALFGVRLAFTSLGASIAVAVMSFPLMVRAIRLSLEAQDAGLDEAARTLGAGPLDRALSLHLPLAAPGLAAAALIGFAAGLGEFGAVITFVGSVPGETQTLPLAIYAALQEPGGEARAARLASLSVLLALAALVLSETLARAGRAR